MPTELRRTRWLAFALAAVPLLLLAHRFWFVCDDAFISFRYVDNLVHGRGLCWNPGEPPVEGFSHPLWVLWLSGCATLGLLPEHTAPWTGLAAGLALLWLMSGELARRLGSGLPLLGAALLLGACPMLGTWCSGGLETMPAVLVGTLLPLHFFGERPPRGALLGALLLALAWLRPEGVLLGAGWLVLFALATRRSATATVRRRALVIAAIVLLLGMLALTVFRLCYFGDYLPNTARAKGGFEWFRLERGLRYLLALALTFPALVAAAALGAIGRCRMRLQGLAPATGIFALLHLGWVVLVGGDFMTMGRFLVPLLPFVALWSGCGLATLVERGHGRFAWLLAATIAGANLLPAFDHHLTPASWRAKGHYGRPSGQPTSEYRAWVQQHDGPIADELLARALLRHTAPGQSLVHGAIGLVGYRTRLRVLDSFALVTRKPADAHLLVPQNQAGHDRMLPWQEFLDDRPDYIAAHLGPPGGEIVYGLLAVPFAVSPLQDLVEVLRFPVDEVAADGRRQELRLLRFQRWELPIDELPSLLACVRGLDPAAPDAARHLMARWAAAAAAAEPAIDLALRRLHEAGRIAHRGQPPLRFSCAAEPSPRSNGFGVFVLELAGDGPVQRLPRGMFVYATALHGAPTVGGQAPGWHVVAPTGSHQERATGGTALLVCFVPDAKFGF